MMIGYFHDFYGHEDNFGVWGWIGSMMAMF